MRPGIVLLGLMLFAFSLNVSAGTNCENISRQILAMEKAQASILYSMANKNSSLAETLDSYADDFSKRGRRIKKGDVVSMQKTAEAFRLHEKRERDLVAKFEKSSQALLKKAVLCLSKNETVAPEIGRETSL